MSTGTQYLAVAEDFALYQQSVKGLSLGKRVGSAVYIAREALLGINPHLAAVVEEAARIAEVQPSTFNVVKLSASSHRVSLLRYEGLETAPFPALAESVTVDLTLRRHRRSRFNHEGNPPILHRKELLFPTDHPRAPEWGQLTEDAEKAGLFSNPTRIGFREQWNRLLRRNGLELVGGRLVPKDSQGPALTQQPSDVDVVRHRTAITRAGLSSPVQSLYDHGFLDRGLSFFDFGCGHGEDVAELRAYGLDANGWDPAFAPDAQKREADLVNLGFILNVIEDPTERTEVLREAYALAKTALVVAAMVGGDATTSRFERYGDGVRTSRNTFQKYFRQAELREYIESTLEASAVAIGQGLFYVFKDSNEQQLFLERRSRIRRDWRTLTNRTPAQTSTPAGRKGLIERHKDLAEDFWVSCLELGRLPADDEFDHIEQLRRSFGSYRGAFRLLRDHYGSETLEEARQARTNDLLVYLALEQFRTRRPFKALPQTQQRDIREFLGGIKAAQETARALLFSVGDPSVILSAVSWISAEGVGYLDGNHSFTVHQTELSRLPPSLRVLVGCAEQLHGDVSGADLIKIHLQSEKVTLLYYDDFETCAVPLLNRRIKIRLRDRDVDYFEYGGEFPKTPLFPKSRYIPGEFPKASHQAAFDHRVHEELEQGRYLEEILTEGRQVSLANKLDLNMPP